MRIVWAYILDGMVRSGAWQRKRRFATMSVCRDDADNLFDTAAD